MLIMASMDHTARLRLLAKNKPNSKSSSSVDDLADASDARREQRQTYASLRAGSALAVAVIEGMLRTHHTFEQTRHDDKRVGLLPLNPVQLIGLETAIDLLYHYVDTLTPEGGG
jgi:hypothetical protein